MIRKKVMHENDVLRQRIIKNRIKYYNENVFSEFSVAFIFFLFFIYLKLIF